MFHIHYSGNVIFEKCLMKQLIIILSLFFSGQLLCQSSGFDLPAEHPCSKAADKSEVYRFLNRDYQKAIAFSRECYWPESQTIYFLGLKGEVWRTGTIRLKYRGRDKSAENIRRTRIRSKKIPTERALHFLETFEMENLISVSPDSLNCDTRIISDSVKQRTLITDGCTDIFILMDTGRFIEVSAYYPDKFNEIFFVRQRKEFIDMRNAFMIFLSKN